MYMYMLIVCLYVRNANLQDICTREDIRQLKFDLEGNTYMYNVHVNSTCTKLYMYNVCELHVCAVYIHVHVHVCA